ncbi:MAG TPA: BspA family leucine-rich repeat surface protein, partial [Algoriphagus sp.]|nr:BspA family leucine-rich repeat surface protein [Algoriphagus sp.]
VINMEGMFSVGHDFSASVFNQPIGNWNVSKVSNMEYMFYGNEYFNQDLSKWCVVQIPNTPKETIPLSWTLPKPVWGTCPD